MPLTTQKYTVTVASKDGRKATAELTVPRFTSVEKVQKLTVPFLCIGLDIADLNDCDVKITIDNDTSKTILAKTPAAHKSVIQKVSSIAEGNS